MRSFRDLCRLVVLPAASCMLAGAAWGQAVDIPTVVTGSQDMNSWVTGTYAHQFETDVDGGPAKFSRNDVNVVAGRRFAVGDDSFLVGNAAYQGSYYDFARGTFNGLRWDDIHRITLMGGAGWTLGDGDDWTLILIGLVRSAGEGSAEFDETITAGGVVSVGYRWSDTLETGLVIGAISQLEDQASIIPIPTVDWRFADSWLLHFGLVNAAGYPGVGPEISYRGEHWSWGFGASYQNRRFRLDDDSGQPSSKGVGQETGFPIFTRVGYAPNQNMDFGVTAGVTTGGETRSGRPGGGRISKNDFDPAGLLGFNANFRW